MKLIIKWLFSLFLINTIILGSNAQDLKIKGSDTLYPLVSSLGTVYNEENNDASAIKVEGGGSGTGVKALLENTVHAAMASRGLKVNEKQALGQFEEVIIAYDALSIIVHPSNPVEQLTKVQLKDIFTGKITNWSDVGGKDLPITIYSRLSSSGTYDFMISTVLDGEAFHGASSGKASNAGIVQSVAENPAGIGYVGLAYVEDVVKPISVSFNGDFVRPTFKNALDKKYPISRPLYLFYKKETQVIIGGFVDFILAPFGQKIVTHKGYIPAKF